MDTKEVVERVKSLLSIMEHGGVRIREPVSYPQVFTKEELKASVAAFERDCLDPMVEKLSRKYVAEMRRKNKH